MNIRFLNETKVFEKKRGFWISLLHKHWAFTYKLIFLNEMKVIWKKLLQELSIKIKKHYKKIKLLNINKQELNFATHGQACTNNKLEFGKS